MTLREALKLIHDKNGYLTPELLLDEARRNRSNVGRFLHERYFDAVDDVTAAERWRLEMAREDIRSVRTRYKEATEQEQARSLRTYHNVPRPDGNVYLEADLIVQDDFQLKLVLLNMEREWKALFRRYQNFQEFTRMVRGDLDDQAA